MPKQSKCSSKCTYASRVVVNTNNDHIGSENWRLDWAKLNNKSYAWVASQKVGQLAVTVRNRNVKRLILVSKVMYTTVLSNVMSTLLIETVKAKHHIVSLKQHMSISVCQRCQHLRLFQHAIGLMY